MESSKYCAICFGGITRAHWTQSLTTVLIRESRVDIGSIRYDQNTILQVSRSLLRPEEQTQIRLIPSQSYTPAEAFIMHTSCYRLVCEFAGHEVRPHQIYRLCQATQPDQERCFLNETNRFPYMWPDPYTILTPRKSLSSSEDSWLFFKPGKAHYGSTFLFKLPPEIMLLILQHLPPSDLVRFFRTSRQALSYASLFCQLNPLHFFRCSTGATNCSEDKQILMLALSTWTRYEELDLRWQLVTKVCELAKLLSFLSDIGLAVGPTPNPRAPLLHVQHQHGLHEDLIEIPNNVKNIQVCSILLAGRRYICGIGVDTGESCLFYGNKTESLRTLDINNRELEAIGLAEDALGVRSMRCGTSPWVFGDPETLGCWGGLSVPQGRRKIQIIRDALKIRYLNWYHETAPLFEETLLIRNQHPSLSSHEFISEELYVQRNQGKERGLVTRFGNFPTEAIRFSRELQHLTLHGGGGLNGISGLSIQTNSESYCVGSCKGASSSMTLHTPDESLSEIDVRISNLYPLALIFRTSWNRELFVEPRQLGEGVQCEIKALRPPPDHCITGLYFRFEGSVIVSVGLIFALSESMN
ncbi:F-box protein [Aspergillus ibericus CBS 121593]|uniref:F-box domain-containing protein n=1 Tax=Aspergillus ibericus CBS 121593 TaxID=1448316 RepID=A0A395H8Z0_9EURO|nr:hypothetical protein BO80DRAFT_499859 [Aspergillus ibericus CBS 121593]RAL04039.1 hypothetical protein BO80DRAFT_499859 [Aspergillus ibericus CBS 121593]